MVAIKRLQVIYMLKAFKIWPLNRYIWFYLIFFFPILHFLLTTRGNYHICERTFHTQSDIKTCIQIILKGNGKQVITAQKEKCATF